MRTRFTKLESSDYPCPATLREEHAKWPAENQEIWAVTVNENTPRSYLSAMCYMLWSPVSGCALVDIDGHVFTTEATNYLSAFEKVMPWVHIFGKTERRIATEEELEELEAANAR